jgi:alpha/beta superfamily hydrolase
MTVEEMDFICREGKLPYGYLPGNEKVVFIKAGLGGDYIGYENKYLKIARLLHEKHGCTVVSVSNPYEKGYGVSDDSAILESMLRQLGIEHPELYLFGNSDGCRKGLALAAEITFRRMILVNMPLTINLHHTRRYLSLIPDTDVIAVYGERDVSYPYAAILEGKSERVQVVRVPDADHNFAGKTEEFIRLAEMLL